MASDIQNNTPENNLNIRKILYKSLINWPYFIICIGIAYSIAFLINRYTVPIYSVNASLIINEERKTSAEIIMTTIDRYSPRKSIENEIAIMKSYSITKRTLSELNFYISYYVLGRIKETRMYNPQLFKFVLDSARPTRTNYPILITIIDENNYKLEIDNTYHIEKDMKFGEEFNHPDFNFTLNINKAHYNSGMTYKKFEIVVSDTNSLVNYYKSKLNVVADDKRSSVVTLSTTGPIPQQEADFINKLAEVYIKNGLEEKNKATDNSIKFIDILIGQNTDSLKKAEIKLQDFKQDNRLIDISDAGKAMADKLEAIQTEKINADLKMKYILYLKNYMLSKTTYDDIMAPAIIGIDEPLLNSTISDLIDLYKQRAALSYSASIDNPAITMIDLKIKKTVEAIRENLSEVVKTAQLQLTDINERMVKIEDEFKALPVKERQLLNIQREFDINNNILTFLLQKRAESGIIKASNIPESKILDAARPEGAYMIKPTRSKNYLTAVMLGILFPLLIIILLELLNTKITDIRDIERTQKCNIIGSIGHNIKNTNIPVFDNPKSALAEAFRSLRTNLQYILREKNERIILITSTVSGEGKTFCSINLASIIAMSNKKVLLMGLDLRKPRVHKLFNLSNDIGLSSYLINNNTSDEIIHPTHIPNLYVIPSGRPLQILQNYWKPNK